MNFKSWLIQESLKRDNSERDQRLVTFVRTVGDHLKKSLLSELKSNSGRIAAGLVNRLIDLKSGNSSKGTAHKIWTIPLSVQVNGETKPMGILSVAFLYPDQLVNEEAPEDLEKNLKAAIKLDAETNIESIVSKLVVRVHDALQNEETLEGTDAIVLRRLPLRSGSVDWGQLLYTYQLPPAQEVELEKSV